MWVQTWHRENAVYQAPARHDYEAFARSQLAERKTAHLPPFAPRPVARRSPHRAGCARLPQRRRPSGQHHRWQRGPLRLPARSPPDRPGRQCRAHADAGRKRPARACRPSCATGCPNCCSSSANTRCAALGGGRGPAGDLRRIPRVGQFAGRGPRGLQSTRCGVSVSVTESSCRVPLHGLMRLPCEPCPHATRSVQGSFVAPPAKPQGGPQVAFIGTSVAGNAHPGLITPGPHHPAPTRKTS